MSGGVLSDDLLYVTCCPEKEVIFGLECRIIGIFSGRGTRHDGLWISAVLKPLVKFKLFFLIGSSESPASMIGCQQNQI
jgi:hypothetical protein